MTENKNGFFGLFKKKPKGGNGERENSPKTPPKKRPPNAQERGGQPSGNSRPQQPPKNGRPKQTPPSDGPNGSPKKRPPNGGNQINDGERGQRQNKRVEPNRRDNVNSPEMQRKYYSEEQSKEVYGDRRMEQNVFMYAPRRAFISIQKYINDKYEGIVVVGTSEVTSARDAFEDKLNSKHIVLFIEKQDEFENLRDLIETGIRIRSQNPDTLKVIIVISGEVSDKALKVFNGNNLLTAYHLPKGFDNLRTKELDFIFSTVVNSQPTYPKERTVQMPKPAVKRKQLDELTLNIRDLAGLKAMVTNARDNSDRVEVVKTVEDKIAHATREVDTIEAVQMIPEYRQLEKYKQELDEYLEIAGENIDVDKANKIIVSRLEVTHMQQEITKEIFSTIINSKDLNRAEVEVRNRNEAIIKALDMKKEETEDIDDLIVVREEMKNAVKEQLSEYQLMVQTISNAVTANSIQITGYQEELLAISDNTDNEEIKEFSEGFISKLAEERNVLVEVQTATENSLVEVVNYTRELLKGYAIIVEVDDLIIGKLLEDRESTTAILNASIRTGISETGVKLKTSTTVLVNEESIKNWIPKVLGITDIVITDIDDIPFKENMIIETPREFIDNTDLTGSNVIQISGEEPRELMRAMLRKIELLETNYTRFAFILSRNISDDWMNMALDNSVETIYSIDANGDDAIILNGLIPERETETYRGVKLLINNYETNKEEISRQALKTTAGIDDSVGEFHINTDNPIEDNSTLDTLKLIYNHIK